MKQLLATIVLGVLVVGTLSSPVGAQENPENAAAAAEHKRLFREGAKLWPLYCNTCHNARPGSEKAPYEWDQIMMHMRTIGNLPPQDATAILEYLKAR